MPIYLAIPLKTDADPLDTAVSDKVDEANRYALPSDKGWFIDYEGTSIELSNFLNITGQEKGVSSPVGAALVLPVTAYFGRGPTDMWEWLKIRLEK